MIGHRRTLCPRIVPFPKTFHRLQWIRFIKRLEAARTHRAMKRVSAEFSNKRGSDR